MQPLTQSQDEKRTRLLANKENVLNASYDQLLQDFRTITSAYLDKPVCTRLAIDTLDNDANIQTGSIEWSCTVANIMNNRKIKIEMLYPIVARKLVKASTFKTSIGSIHNFSDAGFKRALGVKEVGQFRPHSGKHVTWSFQRDI